MNPCEEALITCCPIVCEKSKCEVTKLNISGSGSGSGWYSFSGSGSGCGGEYNSKS
uniref:Uncharacterized protein n=1 Tax=viral metagenome TaxID=1070528 RepID=A0A6C0AVR9_9ZZZZ